MTFIVGIGILLADQSGKVAQTLRADLIGEGNVVNFFFNFVDVFFLVRIKQVETLIEIDPENAAA